MRRQSAVQKGVGLMESRRSRCKHAPHHRDTFTLSHVLRTLAASCTSHFLLWIKTRCSRAKKITPATLPSLQSLWSSLSRPRQPFTQQSHERSTIPANSVRHSDECGGTCQIHPTYTKRRWWRMFVVWTVASVEKGRTKEQGRRPAKKEVALRRRNMEAFVHNAALGVLDLDSENRARCAVEAAARARGVAS